MGPRTLSRKFILALLCWMDWWGETEEESKGISDCYKNSFPLYLRSQTNLSLKLWPSAGPLSAAGTLLQLVIEELLTLNSEVK